MLSATTTVDLASMRVRELESCAKVVVFQQQDTCVQRKYRETVTWLSLVWIGPLEVKSCKLRRPSFRNAQELMCILVLELLAVMTMTKRALALATVSQ